jgi:hypothetical protein
MTKKREPNYSRDKMTSMKQGRAAFFFLVLVLLAGCASLHPQRIPEKLDRPSQCQAFLEALDGKVLNAGVRDASSYPIPDFPYLRINRFLSAVKKELKDEGEREQWLRWMQELDLQAREREIDNLPAEMVLPIPAIEGAQQGRQGLQALAKSCSEELLDHDRAHPGFYETLSPLAQVPDEYSLFMRAVGLYPVTSVPVAVVTHFSREKIKSWYEGPLEALPVHGKIRTYVPKENISLPEADLREMMVQNSKNPLGISLPRGAVEERLLWFFAPILLQDVAGPYDQPGLLAWKNGRAEVDATKPTVYYYFSHAFLKGEPILQINYVVWYSDRAGQSPPAIEKGHLDGLTIRVSLDGQGQRFMVDVMNNCGCYHLFAPDQARVEQVLSQPLQFDAFVPQWLPTLPSGKRLGLRVSSGWHQVQRLLSLEERPDPVPYDLVPYEILETLPHEDGRRESLFDATGIAKGSERKERIILFSMGIPDIGSMRQRGHHAIELIGRVHFDDPLLFDRNFLFK